MSSSEGSCGCSQGTRPGSRQSTYAQCAHRGDVRVPCSSEAGLGARAERSASAISAGRASEKRSAVWHSLSARQSGSHRRRTERRPRDALLRTCRAPGGPSPCSRTGAAGGDPRDLRALTWSGSTLLMDAEAGGDAALEPCPARRAVAANCTSPPPRARRVSPVSDGATSALACGCIPRTSGSSRCHSLCPARNRPASTSSTAAGGAFCLSLRPGLCTMVYSCTRRNRFRLARVPSGPRRARRTCHSFGVPQAATTTTDGRTDAHAPSIGGALAKTSHVLC